MSDTTGDGSWGYLADTEHFGREDSNFLEVPKTDINLPKYCRRTQAGHCMIYAKTKENIFGIYSARAIVLVS